MQRGQDLLRPPELRDEVRCGECDKPAVGPATGWRAYVGGDEGDPVEILVFCPDCATREFGEEIGV